MKTKMLSRRPWTDNRRKWMMLTESKRRMEKATMRVASRRKSQPPNPSHSPSKLNERRGKASSSFPNPMNGFSADSKSEREGGFSVVQPDCCSSFDILSLLNDLLRYDWINHWMVRGIKYCNWVGGVWRLSKWECIEEKNWILAYFPHHFSHGLIDSIVLSASYERHQ